MYDNLTRINLEFAHRQAEKRIEELEKENKTLEGCLLAEQEHTLILEKENEELRSGCGMCYRKDKEQLIKVKRQIGEVKYTLKKIIETVQNASIVEYGARLVLIKDFAYECLEEIKEND